ncbi:hypothetical protein V1524DRAFT_480365 [Lipomyces starkeyi]
MADDDVPQAAAAIDAVTPEKKFEACVQDAKTEKEHADGHSGLAAPEYDEAAGEFTRPSGWMYRERRFGSLTIPWNASPKIQLGMNTALYSTFAVFGFFGGTFVNRLGVKSTLAFGGIGYYIYAISLLVSVHRDVNGFNVFAGALLGICAGLLWTAQGTIMISYPTENEKGRYFAWFWGIFNMGAVIGSLIPLGQNIHVTINATVSDGTYIAFIVLMFIGACLALLLCNASDVIRSDGTRVIIMKNPSWRSEFIGLWETVRSSSSPSYRTSNAAWTDYYLAASYPLCLKHPKSVGDPESTLRKRRKKGKRSSPNALEDGFGTAHRDIRFQVYVAQPIGALPPSFPQQDRSQLTSCLDVLADAVGSSDRLESPHPSTAGCRPA